MIESVSSWITDLSYSVVPALGEALWRGFVLAVCAAIVLKSRRFNASTRHRIWLVILIAICVIPFLVFIPEEKEVVVKQFSLETTATLIEKSAPLLQIPLPVAAGILASVIFISFLRIALLLWACRTLSALRKKSRIAPDWLTKVLQDCTAHAGIHREIKIRLSSKIEAPALVGFFQPVVLFPEHLLIHLTSSEIQQIILHEVAHLKRHDDWAILVQRSLSAIFFFNPAVVWICKQLDFERELACDDSVIQAGGTPQAYALCLTRLAEFSRPLEASLVPSASSQLSRRVDMLLNRSKKTSRISTLFAICAVILLSACAVWILQTTPLLAVAGEKEPAEKIVRIEKEVVSLDDFNSAAERMRQAQMKMEEAREEMLQAAEAMRDAQENFDALGLNKRKELRSLKLPEKLKKLENLPSTLQQEKIVREVEREVRREEARKIIRIEPAVAAGQPRALCPPKAHAPECPLLVPPPPAPESMPSVPELAPPVPESAPSAIMESPEPEVPEINPEPEIDFEANPLPEPEPDLPPQ